MYEHFCGSNPAFATKLRSWGEAGVVKTRSWPTPKSTEIVTVCMTVGYNQGTGVNGYLMWHPVINRVHQTRDTIWLKKMYHKTTKQGKKVINSEPNVGKI